MNDPLFEEFTSIPSKQWKNKIQYELNGADYNETLVWESLEGIKVRPFYHEDESQTIPVSTQTTQWQMVHYIYIHDVEKTIYNATTSLQKGTEAIYFTVANSTLDLTQVLQALPKEIVYFFRCSFLNRASMEQLSTWVTQHQYNVHLLLDPIHHLVTEGNWHDNLIQDFSILDALLRKSTAVSLVVDTQTYQNAGANMVQQVAYACAHFIEYLTRIPLLQQPIFVEVALGSNSFFEIAKLKAMRLLFSLIAQEYPQHTLVVKIIATPTKRNKTIYNAAANQLRTVNECSSAALGGADYISNMPYDALFRKDNYMSQQMARNQLLLLKRESYFNAVNNPTEGVYYIEYLTKQIAEKALDIVKQIEKASGFISSLHDGTIQRKINEAAEKEQNLFDTNQEIILGGNQYINPEECMQNQLELYPFVKQNPRKTLIAPIIERRLAENKEQHRLTAEKKQESTS